MKSHQHPSLSVPPSCPSPRAWAAANQPCCPQAAPLSPGSPTVPSPTWCPSYLSRLCFFPVFFFFSLRMGEELSQLGGVEKKVGALEGGARDLPAPSLWPREAPSCRPPAHCFPWTTHGMHEHRMAIMSWEDLG